MKPWRTEIERTVALLIDLQKIDQHIKTLNHKKQTLPEKAGNSIRTSRPGRIGWKTIEEVSKV